MLQVCWHMLCGLQLQLKACHALESRAAQVYILVVLCGAADGHLMLSWRSWRCGSAAVLQPKPAAVVALKPHKLQLHSVLWPRVFTATSRHRLRCASGC